MKCTHPKCNGVHDNTRRREELCPASVERHRTRNREHMRKLRAGEAK